MSDQDIAELIARFKGNDYRVVPSAIEALTAIGVPAVPALIQALKSGNIFIRSHAADALGKIGIPAVPALIQTLKDRQNDAGLHATSALTAIGIPAVPALERALKNRDAAVRYNAFTALEGIGVPAVPALIQLLKNRDEWVRIRAYGALRDMGDSVTLPPKILADVRLSAQQRIDVLDVLRGVKYVSGDARLSEGVDHTFRLQYTFPDTRTLCQKVLNEGNAKAREGAQTVLNWLTRDMHLLRASHRDTTTEAAELLRGAQGGSPESRPDTLLRASDKSGEDGELSPPRPTLVQRLFRKRKGAGS